MRNPVLSEGDFRKLQDLVRQPAGKGGDPGSEKRLLGEEIMKAKLVGDHELEDDHVRLNSCVEVRDENSGKIIDFQLVMPDSADVKSRRISVFAPLSVAVLGQKLNDLVVWKMPSGETSFRILKVVNQ